MAITVTDRGTFQTAAGGAGMTLAATSSAFSVAVGTILVLGVTNNSKQETLNNAELDFAITDNIGDTGGGAWGLRAQCQRGTVTNGQYTEQAEIWTRVIGTAPGASKTVTFTGTYDGIGGGPHGVTNDGWCAAHLWEAAGQHATPIGGTSAPAAAQNVSTWPMDLGATPASTSAVFTCIHDDNNAGTNIFTEPSGFTEVEVDQTTWGSASSYAYQIGSNVQTPTWTCPAGAAERILGVAVEIVAAASAGLDVPLLYTPPTQAVWRM